jgi:hypothetical protein
MNTALQASVCIAVLGCASLGADSGSSDLRSFLSTPHADRLSTALVQGDTRFLAIGRTAPCAPDAARQPSRRFSIPGTGDGQHSEPHGRLVAEARDYACAYNEELAILLGEAPPRAPEATP